LPGRAGGGFASAPETRFAPVSADRPVCRRKCLDLLSRGTSSTPATRKSLRAPCGKTGGYWIARSSRATTSWPTPPDTVS